MRNSNPKSQMPAMKEKAAKEKDKQARQASTEAVKRMHSAGPRSPLSCKSLARVCGWIESGHSFVRPTTRCLGAASSWR